MGGLYIEYSVIFTEFLKLSQTFSASEHPQKIELSATSAAVF